MMASVGIFDFFKRIVIDSKPPTSEAAIQNPAIQSVGSGISQPERDMTVGKMNACITKKFREYLLALPITEQTSDGLALTSSIKPL